MPNPFYITTTLPYVNADPHIGFALELVQADAIARFQHLRGAEVFFNTGTDEHGLKIHRKATEAGQEPKAYTDTYAEKFKQLAPLLGISESVRFIRTTDSHHKVAAQEFWKRCEQAGDIYKKTYQVKYCVGCELEKTDSELENGHCGLHPNLEIELIDEENYFFRWSKYQQPLLDLYNERPDFVVPSSRLGEIRAFVERGLQDFSISRLASKMPWGVPVPGDDTQVMYVWFDALINYISTLGWPATSEDFEKFWGSKENPNALQVAGKDNLRQQSAMWQAMLMSAGLPTSRQILIHGFITSGGQKMSKSLGNVANPYEVIDLLVLKGLTTEQATDALRFYLLKEISTFEDGDYTWEHFVDVYNGNLANGIGNLVSRVMTMASKSKTYLAEPDAHLLDAELKPFYEHMDKLELKLACDWLWNEVLKPADQYIQLHEPFKVAKTDPEAAKQHLLHLLKELWRAERAMRALIPVTASTLRGALDDEEVQSIPKLFPRLEA